MVAGTDGNLKALGSENNRSGDEAGTCRLCTSRALLGLRIRTLAGRQRLVIVNGTFPGGWGVFLQVAKSILLVVSALFPIVDPIVIAGGILHHWIPRALVLWDFAAGGPGGGRDDRDCDGLGDVEEER